MSKLSTKIIPFSGLASLSLIIQSLNGMKSGIFSIQVLVKKLKSLIIISEIYYSYDEILMILDKLRKCKRNYFNKLLNSILYHNSSLNKTLKLFNYLLTKLNFKIKKLMCSVDNF